MILKQTKAISLLFLSLSVFTYQNLLGPTFSTMLTGLWQSWIVIPSFLGIGCGIWISITFLKNWFDLRKIESFFVQSVFYSFICVFILLNVISKNIDQQMFSFAASTARIGIIENLVSPVLIQYIPFLLLLVSFPFVLFGIILGIQFLNTSVALKAYQLELLGLIIGSVLCIWLLESQSWSTVVKVIVGLSLLSLLNQQIRFTKNKKTSILLCTVAITIFFIFMNTTASWQLQRNLNLIARDFHQKNVMQSLATRWKSFAKVQLLKSVHGSSEAKFFSVGDGTGIATFLSYDKHSHEISDLVTVRLATFQNPKKVAVLFAGAGAEIIGIHKKLGTTVETWAVEINSAIPAIVDETEGENFKQFFDTYNSHYIISDNRRFLETISEKFDSIIYSWSGATIANFSGAAVHTTQYSFTTEALAAATNRLAPNGVLIILGGNKLNVIKSFKFLESQGNLQNIENRILLFSYPGEVHWKTSWDDLILVYKNQDWTTDEVKAISNSVEGIVSLIPSRKNDLENNKLPFYKMLSSPDLELFTKKLWQTENILPTEAKDNHPFAYRNYPSFFDQDILKMPSQLLTALLHPRYLALDGILWISLFLMAMLMVSVLKKDIAVSPDFLQFLAWAPVSSSCFLFYLYKAVLYLGNPTVAFLVVQVATQLGSYLGLRVALKHHLPFLRYVYMLAVLFLAGGILMIENQSISSSLFHLNFTLLTGFLFLISLVTSFLFSTYFISRFTQSTVPGSKTFALFWTFETLFTGLMGLVGAFLIEEKGLMFFVSFSVLLSCLLLFPSFLLKKVKT